ncbi:MAG: pyrroloquinoline quinone-dependent dehydrogenase, partial [Gammaproteobacteria bacterium]
MIHWKLHRQVFYWITKVLPVFICAISGCSQDAGTTGNGDWAYYGRDYTNQRFSPLAEINAANVKNLKLAWSYHTGKTGSFQVSPIVINDIMYLTTPFNDVIALDAGTGREIWRYRHQLRTEKFCCGPANRGPAVAYGKVYMATIDARLIALDQKTGKVIWDIPITDTETNAEETLEPLLGVKELHGAMQTGQSGYTANLAPQVYDDKVFVGIAGAGYGLHLEFEEDGKQILSVGGLSGGGHGLRGFLVAYDAETGKEIWRWYSVPETGWEGVWRETAGADISLNRDIEAEKKSFARYKDTWRYGGGSVWSTPAIDPELGMIYFGTGNPSPQMDDATRPGDNLYTVSLVALDINTGKIKWHYQQVPHDRWGYDVASPPILFDFKRGGQTINAVGQASKTGWFFVHDRRTGELLLRSDPFAPQDNLFARPTEEGVRIVPGTLGATSWSPAAFNPALGTVYIASIYQPSMFYARKLTPEPGKPWQSYTFFRQAGEDDWGIFSAVS